MPVRPQNDSTLRSYSPWSDLKSSSALSCKPLPHLEGCRASLELHSQGVLSFHPPAVQSSELSGDLMLTRVWDANLCGFCAPQAACAGAQE